MTTVYDIPPEMLIKQVAEELKKLDAIKPPEWAMFTKTGVHKQAPPEEEDWWFTRAAAVLRRVYIEGPVGVQRMRVVRIHTGSEGGAAQCSERSFSSLRKPGLLKAMHRAEKSRLPVNRI
jgi:ribosomal protein S19E (S16A)